MKKYYVHVELRDYSDRVVAVSTATCESDISSENIMEQTAKAAAAMVTLNMSLRAEQVLRSVLNTTKS